MTGVRARLIHQIPGRVRLRIASKKNQLDFFQNLAGIIQACEGVVSCSYKLQNGSLLIQYHPGITSWEQICAFAEANKLFVCGESEPAIARPAQPIPSVAELVGQGLGLVDNKMSTLTNGLLDLKSFYFLAHVGLGVRQLSQGYIMSPAYTLLWRALELAKGNSKS